MKKLLITLCTLCAIFACAGVACKKSRGNGHPLSSITSSSITSSSQTETEPFTYAYVNDDLLKGYKIFGMNEDCSENGVLTIPDSYEDEPVVSFRVSNAYSHLDLADFFPNVTEVRIPKSVIEISDSAFFGMKNLKKVVFEEGSQLKYIAEYAFKNCTSLTEIVLPDGLEYCGIYAFENCTSLNTIRLSKSLKSISCSSFIGCTALTDIYASGTNYVAQDGVLYDAEQRELVCYPAGRQSEKHYRVKFTTTEIGAYAFCENPYVESVTMDNVGMIRRYAFANCKNLSAITAQNLYFMEENALAETKWLTHRTEEFVYLGKVFVKYQGAAERVSITHVMSIAPRAFMGNQTLKEVTVSVRTIGDEAFLDCTSLERIYIDKSAPTDIVYIGLKAFDNNAAGRKIIIPFESLLDKYLANELWQPYQASLEVAHE